MGTQETIGIKAQMKCLRNACVKHMRQSPREEENQRTALHGVGQ